MVQEVGGSSAGHHTQCEFSFHSRKSAPAQRRSVVLQLFTVTVFDAAALKFHATIWTRWICMYQINDNPLAVSAGTVEKLFGKMKTGSLRQVRHRPDWGSPDCILQSLVMTTAADRLELYSWSINDLRVLLTAATPDPWILQTVLPEGIFVLKHNGWQRKISFENMLNACQGLPKNWEKQAPPLLKRETQNTFFIHAVFLTQGKGNDEMVEHRLSEKIPEKSGSWQKGNCFRSTWTEFAAYFLDDSWKWVHKANLVRNRQIACRRCMRM